MTPLEELQAAHKRLSELRDKCTQGEWYDTLRGVATHGSDPSEAGRYVAFLGDYIMTEDADLIVTLHRTIDAQLAILADRGLDDVSYRKSDDGSPALQKVRTPDPAVLALARAINGGAS